MPDGAHIGKVITLTYSFVSASTLKASLKPTPGSYTIVLGSVTDLEWERVRTFMAIGSGAMAAEVCMRMGLSAQEAVSWACNVDSNSHEPIKTYPIDNAV